MMNVFIWNVVWTLDGHVWKLSETNIPIGSWESRRFFSVRAPCSTNTEFYHTPDDYVLHRADEGYDVQVDPTTLALWHERQHWNEVMKSTERLKIMEAVQTKDADEHGTSDSSGDPGRE